MYIYHRYMHIEIYAYVFLQHKQCNVHVMIVSHEGRHDIVEGYREEEQISHGDANDPGEEGNDDPAQTRGASLP